MNDENRTTLTDDDDDVLIPDLAQLLNSGDTDKKDDDEGDDDGLREHLLATLSMLKHDEEEDDEDDDEDTGDMDSDDFHNRATDLARRGKNRDAANICLRGLAKFPLNVDLLADVIKYSANAGDMATAEKHFHILMDVPRELWNWRGYTFALDFLMEKPAENEAVCRDILADYKRFLSHEEKAYVAESELEAKLGHHDKSRAILEDTIQRLPNAPQTALRLADIQFERGMYEDVLRTTAYAFVASSEPQLSVNIPYLVLLRCLSEDAILHQRLMRGDPVTQAQIDHIRDQYGNFKKVFPFDARRFHSAIEARLGVLSFATPTA